MALDETQLAELASARETFLRGNTPRLLGPALEPAERLAEVALLLSLPLPESETAVREQIAALRSGTLKGYAAAHVRWAQPVMVLVERAFPDPYRVPRTQVGGMLIGGGWTPDAWAAYVRGLLG